ncbi:Uncharacterized conserved protein YndB, AHSA1/START domain [Cyclobacterium lianum]|uniref:Uncharacterized conserved protein YndB, AHSA1/START domain n=1 Tax=Cyclobacterium lianum TaxID=388280 RepID=A0A1M7N2U0_9BACT|nr:SRPBCC family protein [Cyclobacterium lianum]SHM97823.1 Uncharacterized conserved protein YndB, AHSA1/START domain [Cyclobacterium lianum]
MKKIGVSTTVASDMDRVWEYWTKPEHIIHWNFATDEWHCPRVENELKANAKFSWRMEAKDGSMGFDFEGVYDKIIKNELITYRMTDGRKVAIVFTERDNAVHIEETFEAEGTNSDEQQRAGWQAILDNFKKYVESR